MRKGEAINSYYDTYLNMKARYHGRCMFNNRTGLVGDSLQVSFDDEGRLTGRFSQRESFQSYDGMLHGGMIAAVMDSAMTKCLMGHGVVGYTGRFNIRYRKPVEISRPLDLHCTITGHYRQLYKLRAEARHDHDRGARAVAHASFYRTAEPC